MIDNSLTITGAVTYIRLNEGRPLICLKNASCPNVTFRARFSENDTSVLEKIAINDTVTVEGPISDVTSWLGGFNIEFWNARLKHAYRAVIKEEEILFTADNDKAIEV